MKKYSIYLAVAALVFASLACKTVMGDGNSLVPVATLPPVINPGDNTVVTPETSDNSNDSGVTIGGTSEFPMTDDATNVVNVAGTLNYQTKLSLDEVMAFYRDAYGKQGYTERELYTTVTDGISSFVFDGDPSGKAIVIQAVDLGDGNVNVTITLQDI